MNLSELAQQLDISVSTVSRVLSGNAERYRISSNTVQRVRKAAEKYHATPDPLGTSLRSGRLGMIGLLLPDITNPFFSELARAIESLLREHGMAVLLSDSAECIETEQHLLTTMLARRIDGLIFAPVGRSTSGLLDAIRRAPIPTLSIDRILPDLETPSITLDNFHAGELAANHLIEAGHRKIACLRGDNASHSDIERLNGVRAALKKANLPVKRGYITGDGYSRADGLRAARALLDLASPPQAVITLNGQSNLGVLAAARERNLKLPEDLSIVAFDEQPWSAFVQPALTTVVQPIVEMAQQAATAILHLTGKSTNQKTIGATRLRARIESRDSVATVRR